VKRGGTSAQSLGHVSDEELYRMLNEATGTRDAAFAELYARHGARIWAYCRCVCGGGSSAEDVFQDTFVRFLESARRDHSVDNVPAYLLRIARNTCLNVHRARKPTVMLEDVHLPAHDTSFDRRELLELVTMALDLLPEDYREAFYLREFEDLPYKEIAAMLDTTPVTVRIRVTRARKKIREILHPYLAELEDNPVQPK
jgi:RNA polymerase sigma-70 factor (ECF subfamily)